MRTLPKEPNTISAVINHIINSMTHEEPQDPRRNGFTSIKKSSEININPNLLLRENHLIPCSEILLLHEKDILFHIVQTLKSESPVLVKILERRERERKQRARYG